VPGRVCPLSAGERHLQNFVLIFASPCIIEFS
jgi:hypothetical protein